MSINKTIWQAPQPDPNYKANQAAREAWFDKIAPKGNWKNPIACWIERDDLANCEQAAIFFTGSILRVSGYRGTQVHVEAAGYYETIGA